MGICANMRTRFGAIYIAATAGVHALALSTTAHVIVLGPGSLDMRLLTAKLAARSGFQTSLFAPSGAAQEIWSEQMYGTEDPSELVEQSSDPLRPAMLSKPAAREAALA